jgi:hypothetical protein
MQPGMRRYTLVSPEANVKRTSRLTAVTIAAVLASGSLVSAQWPTHRAAGSPRLANGEVDMAAPTPRTADGRPDLSGTWTNPASFLRFGGVFDIGAAIGGGLQLPIQPWAAALKKERMAAHTKDHPEVWCLPIGTVLFNSHPFPRKIVQTPNLLVILYETHQGVRQVFLDGRPRPDNDPQPWWYGYSRGWWEVDTLVVETTNYRDGGWLDINGSPLTDAGRTIERFRRTSYGQLEIEMTIDDPKAYTQPFTMKLTQQLMPDTELMEMICQENNRTIQHLAP